MVVKCPHREIVKSGEPGSYREYGKCTKCGRVKEYDDSDPKKRKVRVITQGK